MLTSIVKAALDDIGIPARVREAIDKTPDLSLNLTGRDKVVSAGSVIRWDQWDVGHGQVGGKTGLNYWRKSGGIYSASVLNRPEIGRLVRTIVIPADRRSSDIRDIEGLSNSKSPIDEIPSLDDMARQWCKSYIQDVSLENLFHILDHKGIRIGKDNVTEDFLVRYGWDSRIFLINNDGSHHFAAARYLAIQLDQPIRIEADLKLRLLNIEAIHSLLDDFDAYAVQADPMYRHFFEAMQKFDAPFAIGSLPMPLQDDGKVILLQKNDKRAQRVSTLLKQAGVFDLGEHLLELARSPVNSQIYPPPSLRQWIDAAAQADGHTEDNEATEQLRP